MTKFRISYISDCIFVFLLSFMFFYAPTSFFIKIKPASAVVSFFASVICLAVFIFVSRKKHGALAIKKSEEEIFLGYKNFFLLTDDETIKNSILKLFKKLKNQAVQTKNGIALPNGNRVFYKFTARPVGADEIIGAYKSVPKGCSAIFLAISFAPDAQDFAKNLEFRIKLVDFPKLYLVMKENDCLPPKNPDFENHVVTSKKTKIKFIFLSLFDKKKAKTFAFYGILTLFLSRFVAFPIYYTVVGCLFLCYALAVKFLAKQPPADVL